MRRLQSGYTLVELMVVVAIIGVLAAVAVPSFIRYIKKSKTSEAREFVRKIYEGARAYYMDPNVGSKSVGKSVIPPMFPEPSLAPTPALGTCCASGGKCAPSATYWNDPTWIALSFAVDDPHYFQYAYKVAGNAGVGAEAPVDGSNHYTAIAYGDLDCNGVYSTFSAYGEINKVYADGPAGSAGIGSVKPLE